MADPAAVPPAVTVVLPTYRRPELLARAVGSVLEQTFGDWELVVVDDNGLGTPEQASTEAALRALGDDPRFVYLPLALNGGACAARNAGIQVARGRYIAFLDDDDVWYPTKLELQVACFAASASDVALVYGGYRRVAPGGPGRLVLPDGRAHALRELLKRNGIGTTSLVMIRRDALVAVGAFDERLPSKQDIDLYIRLAQRFAFAFVPEPLLDKHRHLGASIGKDYEGVVRANRLFYDKHRAAFEADRRVHHYRLRSFGHEALRAGRMDLGRSLLLRAWRLWPLDLASLGLALVASRRLLAAYRVLRGHRSRPPAPEEA